MTGIIKTIGCKKQHKSKRPNHLDNLINSLNSLSVGEDTREDKDDMMDEDHDEGEGDSIQIDVSFKFNLTKAVTNNDVSQVSRLLLECTLQSSSALPQFDMEFFYKVGKHANGQVYTLLRNSNLFEDYFDKPFYFDAIIEGIAIKDNIDLIKHMTNTHQLTTIKEHKLGIYIHSLIENKAYLSLEVLCGYLSTRNTPDSHIVFKELLSRAIETLDHRIVAIILNGIKPIKTKVLLLTL